MTRMPSTRLVPLTVIGSLDFVLAALLPNMSSSSQEITTSDEPTSCQCHDQETQGADSSCLETRPYALGFTRLELRPCRGGSRSPSGRPS